MRLAAIGGAVWGLAGYALLWGLTPVVVYPTFVASVPGTLLLLPVRLVLWGVHAVEMAFASQPFAFSSNHAWIGVLATVLGAGLGVAAFVLGRAIARTIRRSDTG